MPTYMLRNTETGDFYIGYTNDKKGVRQRIFHHKCRHKKGDHDHLRLYANIRLYGWDVFEWSILDDSDVEAKLIEELEPTLNELLFDAKCSETCKEAIRKANSKPVFNVELNRSWQSASAAEAELGMCRSSIHQCLKKGDAATAGGYHWRYLP